MFSIERKKATSKEHYKILFLRALNSSMFCCTGSILHHILISIFVWINVLDRLTAQSKWILKVNTSFITTALFCWQKSKNEFFHFSFFFVANKLNVLFSRFDFDKIHMKIGNSFFELPCFDVCNHKSISFFYFQNTADFLCAISLHCCLFECCCCCCRRFKSFGQTANFICLQKAKFIYFRTLTYYKKFAQPKIAGKKSWIFMINWIGYKVYLKSSL